MVDQAIDGVRQLLDESRLIQSEGTRHAGSTLFERGHGVSGEKDDAAAGEKSAYLAGDVEPLAADDVEDSDAGLGSCEFREGRRSRKGGHHGQVLVEAGEELGEDIAHVRFVVHHDGTDDRLLGRSDGAVTHGLITMVEILQG